ncbi:JmjC domain protein [Bradyrhizobium oligotrophicum S58]|uniref:JmjC domain protein n=3 Tax=Bradyrhizobium oligotrophicum TaxID=44255 RepID=M4ZH70_9BRAD|nr:JmjC domain protein [Bradyrhizobium oligotrophicum S58]
MRYAGTIERAPAMTHEHFYDAFFQKRPVAMPQKISHWPALTQWSPEFFKRSYGDLPVWLSRYDPHSERSYLDQHIEYASRKTTMADYVDALSGDHGFFSIRESIGMLQSHPELLEHVDGFRPFGCSSEPPASQYMALWFSPGHDTTGMHIDVAEGLLFHIYGHKRVILLAPDQTGLVYEDDLNKLYARGLEDRIDPEDLEMWRNFVRWSKVNPFEPDFERFPALREATYFDVVINPGDVLYIPLGWWHAVRSLDTTISISKSLFKDEFLRA